MSVTNGQIANQTTFNNAFVSKTAVTGNNVTGLINLNHPTSGGTITNVQQEINNKADLTDLVPLVTGPASAVDNSLPRYDGTTGKLIQGSGIVVSDSNDVTGVATQKIGSGALDADAILDIVATDKGVLLPRLTTVQRDALGAVTTSLLIFNTTANQYQYYDGSSWKQIGGGGVGWQETPPGTVNGVNPTFGPLSFLPSSDESVIVYVDGVAQIMGTAWTISTSTITFQSGYIPTTGQDVYVFYLTEGSPAAPIMSGTYRAEYRTITLGEETAEQLTLAFTPATPSYVAVDVIGGGAGFYGDDFIVTGNTLDWSGLGFSTIPLASGDKLRITYVE